MTKTVLQKPKNKPLSGEVRKAMKKYFATLGDTNPANVYEMVMAEVEPELLKAVMKYANNILKGFATAGAIVLTGALAPAFALGPPPNWHLVVGGSLVVGSVIMYSGAATRPRSGSGSNRSRTPSPRSYVRRSYVDASSSSKMPSGRHVMTIPWG